jgi:hypothetical protein
MSSPIQFPPRGVPNYLVQAILCTLFCCLPFGIVAIVFAAQVDARLAAGDCAGAVNSSNQARMWCWIAFGLGLAWIVVCMICFICFVLLPILVETHSYNPSWK